MKAKRIRDEIDKNGMGVEFGFVFMTGLVNLKWKRLTDGDK